ncbi:MAG: RidA family protein [Rhodospirillales bacterium]|jgi:enamine deaminase RidA (YjgF/YER057c/UK114 family)|nr:RidA family protein [Rhodospirillales bacterium]
MSDIKRIGTWERMSRAVVHGGTAYLAGQTGDADAAFDEQTRQTLAKVDEILAEVGSDKTKLLQAVIWLDDMRNFDAFNPIWDAWVPEGCAPARACGEVRMAKAGIAVEVTVVAAAG